MTTILEAKPIRQKRIETLKKRCQALKARGLTPTMQVILVGSHPASLVYTRNKKKFIENFGGNCEILSLPEKIKESDFLAKLKEISESPSVHGCFVQLPLPQHLQHLDIGQMIPSEKDVDGFHKQNLYHLLHGDSGEQSLPPCTPKGILTLLQEHGVELEGKNVVVIGRSMIVGKPMALLLLNQNASVSICHSHTKNLAQYTHNADIVISAVGRAQFFTKEYLNPNRRDQILVDVGINHNEENHLCGDMDFENLKNFCGAITPVPGGVGPMTILTLAENLLTATERACEKEKPL